MRTPDRLILIGGSMLVAYAMTMNDGKEAPDVHAAIGTPVPPIGTMTPASTRTPEATSTRTATATATLSPTPTINEKWLTVTVAAGFLKEDQKDQSNAIKKEQDNLDAQAALDAIDKQRAIIKQGTATPTSTKTPGPTGTSTPTDEERRMNALGSRQAEIKATATYERGLTATVEANQSATAESKTATVESRIATVQAGVTPTGRNEGGFQWGNLLLVCGIGVVGGVVAAGAALSAAAYSTQRAIRWYLRNHTRRGLVVDFAKANVRKFMTWLRTI